MSIAVMRGVSRESLQAAQQSLDSMLGQGDAPESLGADLFGMARIINSSVTLRRMLTDPNAADEDKQGIATKLFGGKVSDASLELVKGLVSSRWAAARDLADATESLGTAAILADSERDGSIGTVEDEVFRFGRIVEANPQLQQALTDNKRSVEDRGGLVDKLLGLRANPHTVQLVKQAVVDPRGRRLDQTFEEYAQAISRRRNESLAFVTSAAPLTEQQAERLTQILTEMYGRPVHLNFDIDPKLVGGIRVQVGDEVIDGSVSSRLEEAKRRLAG